MLISMYLKGFARKQTWEYHILEFGTSFE